MKKKKIVFHQANIHNWTEWLMNKIIHSYAMNKRRTDNSEFRNERSSCFKLIIQCICKRERGDMEKFETRVLHWSKVEHSYATVLLKRIPD